MSQVHLNIEGHGRLVKMPIFKQQMTYGLKSTLSRWETEVLPDGLYRYRLPSPRMKPRCQQQLLDSTGLASDNSTETVVLAGKMYGVGLD